MESKTFKGKESMVAHANPESLQNLGPQESKEKVLTPRPNNSSESVEQFESRKKDHIEQSLDVRNEALGLSGLDKVSLIHNSLPEIDFEEVGLQSKVLGQTRRTPFLVSSMTAGHVGGQSINEALYKACSKSGWIMGVGSQRRELFDSQAHEEWSRLRQEVSGNVDLLSNIGLAQLISVGPDAVLRLVENLRAVGLIVHLNPLQEVVQPEGTPQFKGGLRALADLIELSPVPVIVKETGSGMSKTVLSSLSQLTPAAVDVSGLGGTHWGRIEGARSVEGSLSSRVAQTFRNWGVSTVESTIMASEFSTSFEVWASGGVRTGLDAAKLFALGAKCIGFAKPMLQAAIAGEGAVLATMESIEYELRVALFCTGNKSIEEFKTAKVWKWNH